MNGVEVFVPLTRGFVAVVDLEDWDKVRPHNWHAQSCKQGIYAARTVHELQPYAGPKRKSKTVLMHRVIMGLSGTEDVDHRNGNKLDNRRDNLRPATRSNNCGNQKIRSSNKSGFKGVYWKKWRAGSTSGLWASVICVNYKKFHLGYFSTAEEAARAYDTAAQRYFGPFAKLNFANAPKG